jgi:hypothetical protein
VQLHQSDACIISAAQFVAQASPAATSSAQAVPARHCTLPPWMQRSLARRQRRGESVQLLQHSIAAPRQKQHSNAEGYPTSCGTPGPRCCVFGPGHDIVRKATPPTSAIPAALSSSPPAARHRAHKKRWALTLHPCDALGPRVPGRLGRVGLMPGVQRSRRPTEVEVGAHASGRPLPRAPRRAAPPGRAEAAPPGRAAAPRGRIHDITGYITINK